jgi:hypothetical protein
MDNLLVQSKTTYQDYKNYYWFYFTKSKVQRITFVVLIALYLWMLGVLVPFMLDYGFEAFVEILSPITIIGLLAPGWLFFLPRFFAWFTFRNVKSLLEGGSLYEFGPDTVKITTKGSKYTGTSEMQYEGFVKAYEARGAFYLYISSLQAFSVSKQNMDAGQTEALKTLLSQKLGKRFQTLKEAASQREGTARIR